MGNLVPKLKTNKGYFSRFFQGSVWYLGFEPNLGLKNDKDWHKIWSWGDVGGLMFKTDAKMYKKIIGKISTGWNLEKQKEKFFWVSLIKRNWSEHNPGRGLCQYSIFSATELGYFL